MDSPQLEPPYPPRLSILHRLSILVVPLSVGVPDLSVGTRGQFQRSDQIVLVAMGLQDTGDAKALPGGLLDVDVAVTPWVNDGRLILIADEIRVMG
jgi:hypothetical protein